MVTRVYSPCVRVSERVSRWVRILLYTYSSTEIATATVRGQQSITVELRDHTLDTLCPVSVLAGSWGLLAAYFR